MKTENLQVTVAIGFRPVASAKTVLEREGGNVRCGCSDRLHRVSDRKHLRKTYRFSKLVAGSMLLL
jgi:hypothetical protein